MAPVGRLGTFLAAVAQVAAVLDVTPPQDQDGSIIPGRFIVRLKSEVDRTSHLSWVQDVHRRSISRRDTIGVEKTYSIGTLQGYSGEFDDHTIAQIRENSNVTMVEPDKVAYFTTLVTQPNVTWGLESISSLDKVSGDLSTGHRYIYDDSAGSGTHAYLLDTGVVLNDDFEGRVVRGHNSWEGTESFEETISGHGTHTAGTIGSATYGVAKKATIIDVKVGYSAVSQIVLGEAVKGISELTRSFKGATSASYVLDGLNWAVNNITNTPGRAEKSVISMSIGLSPSSTVNAAVKAAYDMGIVSVVAAGNDNKDASTRSPASEESAITVGAVDWTDRRAPFSNYGPVVDIFAPGVNVTSWWWTFEKTMVPLAANGTSMATPHVAGLVLYLKALEGLTSAQETIDRVKDLAQQGVVLNAGPGSQNLLAYNNAA